MASDISFEDLKNEDVDLVSQIIVIMVLESKIAMWS
jgi:hypothetical protein